MQDIQGGDIFCVYKELGIHFVLVVEEFDRAPIAFPKMKFSSICMVFPTREAIGLN